MQNKPQIPNRAVWGVFECLSGGLAISYHDCFFSIHTHKQNRGAGGRTANGGAKYSSFVCVEKRKNMKCMQRNTHKAIFMLETESDILNFIVCFIAIFFGDISEVSLSGLPCLSHSSMSSLRRTF